MSCRPSAATRAELQNPWCRKSNRKGKTPYLIPVGPFDEVNDGQSLKTASNLDVLVEVFVLAELLLAVFAVVPMVGCTTFKLVTALTTKFPKCDAARTAAKNAAEKSAPTYLGTDV